MADAHADSPAAPSAPRQRTLLVPTPDVTVAIQTHVPPGLLAELEPDSGIDNFSHPDVSRSYLSRIAAQPLGSVTAAYPRGRRLLIAYVAVSTPDPETRWGMAQVPDLLEMVAIEVSRGWRTLGLAVPLVQATFEDPWYDDKVVVSNEFVWHWDLEGSGLTKWRYRVILRRVLHQAGFQEFVTDEPNVRWDPANIFMVRIGPQVPADLLRRFDELLFQGP